MSSGEVKSQGPQAATRSNLSSASSISADAASLEKSICPLEDAADQQIDSSTSSSTVCALPPGLASSRANSPPLAAAPYSVFSTRAKWALVALVSTCGIFSPLSANAYFPALPAVAESLHVSTQSANLSVTVFMLLQATAPTIWGATCDVVGRRPVYLACFAIYIASCLGLAFTESYWLLMVLRCIQAAGSASVVALGSGTIGDIAPPKERGGYMGVYSLGAMLGPCIGPLAGGLLADRWGWHAIFFFLSAFASVVFLIMLALLPETLRSMVGDGSVAPSRLVNRSLVSIWVARRSSRSLRQPPNVGNHKTSPQQSLRDEKPRPRRSINPLASLVMFRELDVVCLLTFNAIVYSLFYALITSMSTSVKTTYGLSESALGLCYLANGGGMIAASGLNGPRLNRDFRVVAAAHEARRIELGFKDEEAVESDVNDLGDFPIEHARLRSLPYSLVLMLASSVVYGWTVDKAVHLSVPLICQFGVGFASMTQFTSISTLLVDLFPHKSASATASNNLSRCLLGAGATAVIDPIIGAMGNGWAFTMLSLITLASAPLLVIEWRHGQAIRLKRAARLERQEAVRAEKEREREAKVHAANEEKV